jgi:hypothetical protein
MIGACSPLSTNLPTCIHCAARHTFVPVLAAPPEGRCSTHNSSPTHVSQSDTQHLIEFSFKSHPVSMLLYVLRLYRCCCRSISTSGRRPMHKLQPASFSCRWLLPSAYRAFQLEVHKLIHFCCKLKWEFVEHFPGPARQQQTVSQSVSQSVSLLDVPFALFLPGDIPAADTPASHDCYLGSEPKQCASHDCYLGSEPKQCAPAGSNQLIRPAEASSRVHKATPQALCY